MQTFYWCHEPKIESSFVTKWDLKTVNTCCFFSGQKDSFGSMTLSLILIRFKNALADKGDRRVMGFLIWLQPGYTKCCCCICLWESRTTEKYYLTEDITMCFWVYKWIKTNCTSSTTKFLLLHTMLHVSTLFVGHFQAFIQLGLQMLCMLESRQWWDPNMHRIWRTNCMKAWRWPTNKVETRSLVCNNKTLVVLEVQFF